MHSRLTLAVRLCLVVLLGLVSGCGSAAVSAQSVNGPVGSGAAARLKPAVERRESAAVAQRDRGLFYRAQQGVAVVYLLGSIHVGTSELYPMRSEIERAFDEADTAVVEIALDEQSTQRMRAQVAQAMTYPGGDSLEAHLSAETRQALRQFVQQSGLPEQTFARLRPWAAALVVTTLELQRAKYSAKDGMDLYFQRRAAQSGKPVEALETAEEQLELLTGIDEPLQELMLRKSLEDRDTLRQTVADAVAAWRRGDADGLARALLEPMRTAEYRTLFDRVFRRRNQRMAEAVERLLLKGGKHFVVLGSGHLIGEGGVVELLRRAGCTVEQR